MGEKLRSDVWEATSPRFESTVIAKFARFPWEIPSIDDETTTYQWIKGRSIGPRFLGHMTEEGRAIGIVMEKVEGGRSATIDDLALCSDLLFRDHSIGVKHGDVNKYNFVVQDCGATLVVSETAQRCEDSDSRKEEMKSLSAHLTDVSTRGGSEIIMR